MALGVKPNGKCEWEVFTNGEGTDVSRERVEDCEDWDLFSNRWEAICENPKHSSRDKEGRPHYRCRFCHVRTDNDTIYKACPNPAHHLEGLLIMISEGREV